MPTMKRFAMLTFTCGLGLALCACAADLFYLDAQYAARAECEKLITVSDRQRCRDANSMSKEQYEAERAKGSKRE